MSKENIELFKERMRDIFKEQSDDFFKMMEKKARSGFIINTKKGNKEDILKVIDLDYERYPLNKNAFYSNEESIGKTKAYELGLIYPQEPSASLPALLPRVEGKKVIVDLCAAPGGKTAGIINRADEDAFILANDFSYHRAQILSSNMERLGHENVVVTSSSVNKIADVLEKQVELVILDAPCSGEGMIRKYPEILEEYSIKNIELCANRQKELIEEAYRLLKPGAELLYSTCTYSKEEDEDLINEFLKSHPDMHLTAIKDNKYFIKMSFLDDSEGQFMCLLKKDGELIHEPLSLKLKKETNNKIFIDFMHKYTDIKDGHYYEDEGRCLFSFKPLYQFPFSVLRNGIYAGDISKKVFLPSHSLYRDNQLSSHFKDSIELNDEEYLKYVKGLEIDSNGDDGYYLLTWHGYPLGFSKRVMHRLKNKYPKGLRRMI